MSSPGKEEQKTPLAMHGSPAQLAEATRQALCSSNRSTVWSEATGTVPWWLAGRRPLSGGAPPESPFIGQHNGFPIDSGQPIFPVPRDAPRPPAALPQPPPQPLPPQPQPQPQPRAEVIRFVADVSRATTKYESNGDLSIVFPNRVAHSNEPAYTGNRACAPRAGTTEIEVGEILFPRLTYQSPRFDQATSVGGLGFACSAPHQVSSPASTSAAGPEILCGGPRPPPSSSPRGGDIPSGRRVEVAVGAVACIGAYAAAVHLEFDYTIRGDAARLVPVGGHARATFRVRADSIHEFYFTFRCGGRPICIPRFIETVEGDAVTSEFFYPTMYYRLKQATITEPSRGDECRITKFKTADEKVDNLVAAGAHVVDDVGAGHLWTLPKIDVSPLVPTKPTGEVLIASDLQLTIIHEKNRIRIPLTLMTDP